MLGAEGLRLRVLGFGYTTTLLKPSHKKDRFTSGSSATARIRCTSLEVSGFQCPGDDDIKIVQDFEISEFKDYLNACRGFRLCMVSDCMGFVDGGCVGALFT